MSETTTTTTAKITYT